MTIDLESRVRAELSAMAESLGVIDAPGEMPAPVLPLDQPLGGLGRDPRRWLVGAAATCLLLVGAGVVVWQWTDGSDTQVVTSEEGRPTGTTVPVDDDVPPADDAEEPPLVEGGDEPPTEGTWRPPHPERGASLLRFDPTMMRIGDLPDGQHFGILDRVAEVDGVAWVRFSRGDLVTGPEADRVRAEVIIAAGGDPEEPEDEMVLRHDWWTPEWGPESYIYPDFDAPVRLPVDLDRLTIVVPAPMEATGSVEVPWQRLLDEADSADPFGVLPWYWSGHVDITITDGEVTRIEAWYTP